MSLFAKKSSISTQLIFDIESDSVCVSIVIYESNKAPRIVYNHSTEIVRKAHTDGSYLTRSMFKALETAAQNASTAIPGLIGKNYIDKTRFDSIHFVLSSPWIISKLSSVEKSFDKETVIRQPIIASIIQKEKDEISKLFAAGDSVAIDTKLFEIKLNGYHVIDYENKRARNIGGTFVISFASRTLVDDLKSKVNRFFRARNESFHSATFLRYVALRSVMPPHIDYIWLQIHGELTDVCVIRNGVCALSGSMPFGSDTLVRKFAGVTNENETTSASLLQFLDSGGNTVLSLQKTRSVLDKVLPDWARGISNIISSDGIFAPVSRAYISAAHFSSVFESNIKQLIPSVSVIRAGDSIMAPFVEYIPSVTTDISSALYVTALPMAQKL